MSKDRPEPQVPRALPDPRGRWERLVRLGRQVPWGPLALGALLVLPVLLVVLAYLGQLDPQVQRALRAWVWSWCPSRSPAPD